MYARTTTVRGDPRAVEDGIAYCRDAVWPMLQNMSGCVGMSVLADRDAGRTIVTAAWATDEALRASTESVRGLRSQAAEVMRADTVDVAEWEISALHRVHAAGDDACARVLWADIDPASADSMIDIFRMTLQPRLEEIPGFCSASLLVDRSMGRASTSVTYESRDALVRSRQMGLALREETTAAMGASVTEAAEFDLVLAHLRVPEMA
jgi:heme-degrading monooxygenase HmoA